jgi:HicA toxin of bacterial toxin-antitoxin,
VYHSGSVNKHQRIRADIFEKKATIKWADIEAMLKHNGAEITEGSGSRARVVLNGVRATFHRPHPRKEASRGAVASMQGFLRGAGCLSEGMGA